MLPVTTWSFAAATELANTETDRADAPGRGPPRTACAAANLVGKLGSLGFEVTLCRTPEPEPGGTSPAQAA